MRNEVLRRGLGLMLAAALCLGLIPGAALASDAEVPASEPSAVTAEGSVDAPVVLAEDADGAAFGQGPQGGYVEAWRLEAWTNDALDSSTIRALLNRQTLHPQKTGWDKLDALLEQMLARGGSDTYSRLWEVYDWMVKNVTYSWEGYSNQNASVASYNSVDGYDYLQDMTYEDGLKKSIPDDMANRTYHLLSAKKGVCYDYAIAFAVAARFVGIDAYVRTGRFTFENTSLGHGHHGWAVLMLDGQPYIFDPQRDARNWEQNDRRTGFYFGIPSDKTYRYDPNYWPDDQVANPQRDASMLSVSAPRAHEITVTTTATQGGTVSGGGRHLAGESLTLTQTTQSGYRFDGWFDAQGELLSRDSAYTFVPEADVTITAKFVRVYTVALRAAGDGSAAGGGSFDSGADVALTASPNAGATFTGWYLPSGAAVSTQADYRFPAQSDLTLTALFSGAHYIDVPADIWYHDDAEAAAQTGIVQGYGYPVLFAGDATFTRAMAAEMLSRLVDADTAAAQAAPFTDVPADQWYAAAVNWGYDQGVIQGVGDGKFAPDATISRQEFLVLLERLLTRRGLTSEPKALTAFPDGDDTAAWAAEDVARFYGRGLVQGDDSGKLLPEKPLSRSEGVTLLMRVQRYLEQQAG